MAAARSFLFVPADRPDMLAKATARGADALILDLEDAVAPSAKASARRAAADWTAGLAPPPPDVWIRVNHPGPLFSADVQAVAGSRVAGIMIPKVSSVSELEAAAELIDATPGAQHMMLLPIIETAAGMLRVAELAACRRVSQLMIGEFDLGAELGIDPAEPTALVPLRMQVVVASAAAGLEAPLGPVSPDFQDLERLAIETEGLVALGFGSRPAIHPAQVPVFNRVFSPSPEAVARAERLVEQYDVALAEGRGAVTDEAGHMIDEAVVKVARRLLLKTRSTGASDA